MTYSTKTFKAFMTRATGEYNWAYVSTCLKRRCELVLEGSMVGRFLIVKTEDGTMFKITDGAHNNYDYYEIDQNTVNDLTVVKDELPVIAETPVNVNDDELSETPVNDDIDHSNPKVRCAYACASDAIALLSKVTDKTSLAELRAIWAGFKNAEEFLNPVAFSEYASR